MLSTFLPIVNEVRLAHVANAASPIFTTVSGITTDVIFMPRSNAPSPMLVTPLSIMTVSIKLISFSQGLREDL